VLCQPGGCLNHSAISPAVCVGRQAPSYSFFSVCRVKSAVEVGRGQAANVHRQPCLLAVSNSPEALAIRQLYGLEFGVGFGLVLNCAKCAGVVKSVFLLQ